MKLRRVLLVILALVLAAVGAGVWYIGPRNIIGILFYDQRREGDLQVGQRAPDVALARLEGGETRLASLVGDKPLVLVFGSFTWPPFRRTVARLQEIAKKRADDARFLTIYIKEAHPTDEWQVTSNETEGICYPQPRTVEDRLAIARDFCARFKYDIPILADKMTNDADRAFAAWPERIYIIDRAGTIAFKGKLGPFGFDPEDIERFFAK
jgi:iodothyronine deiodinase-like protein